MAKLNILDSTETQLENLLVAASKLPPRSRVLLLPRLASDIVTGLPISVKTSVDPIMDFARTVIEHYDNTKSGLPKSDVSVEKLAGRILALKTGVTGSERALTAAVLLHHRGTLLAPARTMNETNNEFKGAFVANISTAIASAVKDRLLEEVPNGGQSDYRVTPQGFSFFSFLCERLKDQLAEQQADGTIESQAV